MDRADGGQRGAKPFRPMLWILAVLPCCLYAALQLGALGHPLFWQDEGETAMFGQRILDYGYPKVHDGGNVVFGMGVPLEYAVEGQSDAYTGSLWGQYYLAALGVQFAKGVEELHAHTARVRLPFVLLGMAGLGLLFLSVSPLFSERRRGRAAGFAGYGLLLCLSTSLILHLREVRYYAPALACLAGVVWLQMRRPPGRGEGGAGRAWGMGGALLVLFNFFHPAALAAGLWVCIEWFVWARRAPGPGLSRVGRAGSLWLSLAAFGSLALGIAWAFGIPTLSRIFAERWGFGPELYGTNLVLLAQYLLRYELLGPVLLAEAVLLVGRRQGRESAAGLICARGSLLRLVVLYALVGAGNPIFFERYFVPVGPLLILVLLLDLEILWRGFGHETRQTRRPRGLGIALSSAILASILWIRADELVGHVQEIRRPVVGPVDAAIEFIQARYPDPAALMIATNYEAEPYMYYLGSRVVGRFHGGTAEADAAEAALEPDLVIPRSAQPRSLQAVRRYLMVHPFERHELPVADVAYNNIPELSPGRLLSTTHRFATPQPGEDGPPLAIYERHRER